MIFNAGDNCPNCKVGKLAVKEGRWGVFLGCDMYRSGCNFISKMDPADNKGSLEKQADEILRLHHKEYLIT